MNKRVKKVGILIKIDENTFNLIKSGYFIHFIQNMGYSIL